MRDKVLRFISEQSMLLPGDRVICAVSGGKDSMALLHLLCSLRDALKIQVSAAHFNHQLRGEESRRDEEFVRNWCAENSIPLTVGTGDVAGYAREQKRSYEEAARILRYEFLQGIDPGAKIATAHTAEDNLETVLMNLIRGCGLNGLSGIPAVRDNLIRPLLLTEKQEILDYLAANGIPHVEDSSNESSEYTRNRIRNQVLPLLYAENPGLPGSASASFLRLREENQVLTQLAAEALAGIRQDAGISVPGLLALPRWLQYRCLMLYLAPVPEPASVHFTAALELCRSDHPSGVLTLPENFLLRRSYDLLSLETAGSAPEITPVLLTPGVHRLGSCTVTAEYGPCPETQKPNTFALRLPVSGSYTLRTRLPGDRITLPGGTKKLSRWMIDQKIPAHLRSAVPVVALESDIFAVLPYRLSAGMEAEPGETCLILTVS